MFYNLNGNYIKLLEISSIKCGDSGDPQLPYNLRVNMNDGREYGVKYRHKNDREKEARNIVSSAQVYYPSPVSRYEVQSIVQKETEKLRRDIRQLRKMVETKEGGG